jgi:cytochrome P450
MGSTAPKDPTTELLGILVDGDPLSDADIVSIFRNWTAGDLGSMAAAVGVVLYFLAVNPDVQEALRAEPSNSTAAIEEMLRIDDPFLVSRRITTETTRLSGYVLDAGTRIYLNWTSANRDESVFGDPNSYRPEEHAANNVVYGAGIHVCPGRPLATLELVVAVQTLLSMTARFELAADVEPIRETYPLGGWRRVPLLLD